MPSVFTTNFAIEQPEAGEQSGIWGNTVNRNYDIFDRLSGVTEIRLTSTSHTLQVRPDDPQQAQSNASPGNYRVLRFTDNADLGGNAVIDFTPNAVAVFFLVSNDLRGNRNLLLRQGGVTGNDVTVENGSTALVYTDGGGSSAQVIDLTARFNSVQANGYRGTWTSGGTYTAGDSVLYSDDIYLTTTAKNGSTTTPSADDDWVNLSDSGTSSGGITNLIDDTTPQLGGNLDLNGHVIGESSSLGIELRGGGTSLTGNFALSSASDAPEGVAIDLQGRFFVIDDRDNLVYGYNSDVVQNSSLNFSLTPANAAPLGITIDQQGRYFIADIQDNKVYGYNSNGSYNSGLDFNLTAANGDAVGIAIDPQGRYFVVDQTDTQVYGYNSDGTYNSSLDFNLTAANGTPNGIAIDSQGRFFVTDFTDNVVYGYNTDGTYNSSLNFNLNSSNNRPTGITIDSRGRFFVCDSNNQTGSRLYRYGEGTSVYINGLRFPTEDGTAGQVLTTDGNGNLSWINN